jgi:hypothetical protein
MAYWTDRRRLAARAFSTIVIVIYGIAVRLRMGYHTEWGNAFLVAVGLLVGWIILAKTVESVLALLFGWSTKGLVRDRKLRPKFASSKKEEGSKP